MKFSSKADFVESTNEEWERLWQTVDDYAAIAADAEPVEQVSEDAIDWTVKDILAHLYAWHGLLLTWHKQGLAGLKPAMPASGYNWRQTRALNLALFKEHRGGTLATMRRKLKRSHGQVMALVEKLSEAEFMESGHFEWTGKHAASTYIAPNTASHYRWAIRKIKQL